MEFQHITLDRSLPVWILTVHRPECRNALALQTLEEIDAAVQLAAADQVIRALVVTGSDGHFIAGGDLRELKTMTERTAVEAWSRRAQEVLRNLNHLACPVIAAMEGNAVGGGCELALACDIRIAGESARFKFWEIKLAVTTGWGGGRRLAGLVGRARALELLLTGESLNAVHALGMGLVNHVVPDGHALQAALNLAGHIATLSAPAVHEMKALIYEVEGLPEVEADEREAQRFVRTWLSPDHQAAVEGYFQHRGAKWQGQQGR